MKTIEDLPAKYYNQLYEENPYKALQRHRKERDSAVLLDSFEKAELEKAIEEALEEVLQGFDKR